MQKQWTLEMHYPVTGKDSLITTTISTILPMLSGRQGRTVK